MDISKLRQQLADTQRDAGDKQMLLDSRLKKLEGSVFKQGADSSLEKDKLLTEVEQLKTQLQEIQTEKPVVVPNLNKTDQVAQTKLAYENKEYERAISGCEAFLSKYPDDKQFTAQILFWRGDAYYELGEFKKAVLSYQDLLTRFQTFSKVPEALYKVGLSLEALNFPKDAAVFFDEIVQKHSKSPFVAKAKERLKKKKK
ncbi:MAG: tetratricopeptide repeat protein [Myxococcaceae bacterium]